MRIPIVFSTDHNFVMQTGVCILSLLKSARTSLYDIYILINNDVSDEDKLALSKQVGLFPGHKINFIEIGDIFKGAFEIRGISNASYSRLLIPWLMPNHDKVFYCDVDIIFKIDLNDIYAEDIGSNLFGAVPAIGTIYEESFYKYVKRLGFAKGNYFNAGVLIVNCKLQRELELKDKILIESKKKYIYQDQDIINIIAKNRIKRIPSQYNVTPLFYELYNSNADEVKDFYGNQEDKHIILSGKDCVIHYAGPKPWNSFTYAWREWWDVYSQSMFYNPELELKITNSCIHPHYTWRNIARIIKHKLLK